MIVEMEALDGHLLDCVVHPLDIAIRPRVVWLREAVLDIVGLANHVEAHGLGRDGVAIPRLPSKRTNRFFSLLVLTAVKKWKIRSFCT